MTENNKTPVEKAIEERREVLKEASLGVKKSVRNVEYGANLWSADNEGEQYAFFQNEEEQAKARIDDIEDKLDNILTDEDIQEIKNQLEACRSLLSDDDDDKQRGKIELKWENDASPGDTKIKHSGKLKTKRDEDAAFFLTSTEEDK